MTAPSPRPRRAAQPAARPRAVACGARQLAADMPWACSGQRRRRRAARPTCRACRWSRCSFPKWTDGRAYSQARLLRTRLRFARRDPRHRRGAGRHAAAAAAHRLRRGRCCAPTSRGAAPSAPSRFFPQATTRAMRVTTGRCSHAARHADMGGAVALQRARRRAPTEAKLERDDAWRCRYDRAADTAKAAASGCRPPAWAPRTW